MRFPACFLTLFLLLTASCRDSNSSPSRALSQAASIMESDHERAFAILDSMDIRSLRRKEAARYSMLKSMVLDKKYVDLTTDSLISPAVRYYAHHGSPDDRLKTAFYHARILENRGEADAALDLILKGERFIKKVKDHLFAGRYYMKKSQLYLDKFEWDKALYASLAAEQQSRIVDNYRGLATALLTCSANYKVLHVHDSAYIYLERIKPMWDKIDDYRKGQYYRQRLTYSIIDGKSDTDSILTECLASGINSAELPYIAFADYYLNKGDAASATESLQSAVEYGQIKYGSKEYENRCFKIDAVAGRYQDAYESMSRYYERLEEYEYGVLTSDARILEERINSERKVLVARFKLWATIAGLVLVAVMATIVISRLVKRQRALSQAVREAKAEKKELEQFLGSGAVVTEDMAKLLSDRIQALNDVVISKLTSGKLLSKSTRDILDSIAEDRDGFILSVAMQYSLSHPAFVIRLRGYNLTSWEIGFCCLYMMGLSGKEISGYVLSSSNVYNVSSRIRQKLGLSQHDTNLPIFLKTLFTDNS